MFKYIDSNDLIYESKEKTLFFKDKIDKVMINHVPNQKFDWYYVKKKYLVEENKVMVPFVENLVSFLEDDMESKCIFDYFCNKEVYFFLLDSRNVKRTLINLRRQNFDIINVYDSIHTFNFLLFTDDFEIMCYNNNDNQHYWFGKKDKLEDLFKKYAYEFVKQFEDYCLDLKNDLDKGNDIFPYDTCLKLYYYYKDFFFK